MWKEIVENVVDPVAVVESRGEPGRLVFQNGAHKQLLDAHPVEYLGEAFYDQVRIILDAGDSFVGVLSFKWKGELLYFLGHFFPVAGGNNYVFHLKDIRDLVKAQQEIVREHDKYEFLLSNIPGVVGLLNSNGEIFYVSPSVKKVKGFSSQEVEGQNYFERIHPQDVSLTKNAFQEILEGRRDRLILECRQQIKDGSYRFFEVSFRRIPRGVIKGFDGVIFSELDVTSRKQMEYKFLKLTYTDDVTGLPNRRLFIEKLKTALGIAGRSRSMVAVVVFDIQGMRKISDLYGGVLGDVLLREFGGRLLSSARASDIVGRLWSDEFVAALVGIRSIDKVECAVRRLVSNITGYYNVSGQSVYVDTWTGVSVYPLDGKDPEELVRRAHLAMSYAKERGEKICFYSDELEGLLKEQQAMRDDLVRAIRKREFVLYYQPIVSASDFRPVAAEALVRWIHPEKGLIMPDSFISLAESTGLIHQLSSLILEMAVERLKKWRKKGIALRLALNVSRRELNTKKFIEDMEKVAGEIDPTWMELEITETAAFEDVRRAQAIMERIKELGFGISLDDFGTGYSSLEALVSLPVDRLKIDRVFVTGMFENGKNSKVVKTILDMARALRVGVVAEGVETERHAKVLREWGCQELQGFYFARPMPADEFEMSVLKGV